MAIASKCKLNLLIKTTNRQTFHSPSTSPTVAVVGDLITRNIIGSKLSGDQKVKSYSFPGATIEDLADHIKPVLRKKPKHIILHVGTNNLRSDKPKTVKKKNGITNKRNQGSRPKY